VAPAGEHERVLAQIWAEVLGLQRVGADDNFFDLGGHSLIAITTIARFRKQTGLELDPREYYRQTLAQLVAAAAGTVPAPRAARTASTRLEPFFFGAPGRELFGLLRHPATPNGAGVLVCPPHAHEYIRCHRALRELSLRLARAGLTVLSFDYSGTGDSAGEYEGATLAQWRLDARAALDALVERAGTPRVAILGLRLGATLAWETARGRADVSAVALWDPVVSGADIDAELVRIAALQALDPVRQRDVAYPDVLGYPLTSTLAAELRALDLVASGQIPAGKLLALETGGSASVRRLADRATALGAHVDYRTMDESPVWLREPYEAVVPRATMEALVAWTGETLA